MGYKILRWFLLSMMLLTDALRILVVFPMYAKSHNILGQGVVNNLLEAGHEVVFITSFPGKNPTANLTEIDCSHIRVQINKKAEEKSQNLMLQSLIGQRNVADTIDFMYLIADFNKLVLKFEPVTKFLSDPKEKFDLVILEWFFSETVSGIPPLFKCPFIWMGSTEVHGHILRIIDEVPNPAFAADLFSNNIPPYNFWERAVELVTACWRHFVVNFLIGPYEKSLYNEVFPEIAAKRGVQIPSYEEAALNASMLLVNSHPSVGTPFKLPQNVKYIGGYHINTKFKPLPEDLKQIMGNSKHGVIYFSMGSNLQSKDMSSNMKESLINMFGKLKEDIIWKFEDVLDNVPSNVHLIKWAPQPNILAHPNIKLFITHGGQLSTTEAIHFGVPIVGLPMYGDQFINMQSVEKKGFGVMLGISEDFTNDLRMAIEKVLRNPEYKNNANYLSAIYHDRLATPGKELVYWAEHVVRTKGASHLRSPAFMVPWYQKVYLDLTAVLILVAILAFMGLKVSRIIMKKQKKEK